MPFAAGSAKRRTEADRLDSTGLDSQKRTRIDRCVGKGCYAIVSAPGAALLSKCPAEVTSCWSVVELARGCKLCGGCAVALVLSSVPDVPTCPACGKQSAHSLVHQIPLNGHTRAAKSVAPNAAVLQTKVHTGAGRGRKGQHAKQHVLLRVRCLPAPPPPPFPPRYSHAPPPTPHPPPGRGIPGSLTVAFKHTPESDKDPVIMRVGSFREKHVKTPRCSVPCAGDPFGDAAAEQCLTQLAASLYVSVCLCVSLCVSV